MTKTKSRRELSGNLWPAAPVLSKYRFSAANPARLCLSHCENGEHNIEKAAVSFAGRLRLKKSVYIQSAGRSEDRSKQPVTAR